MLLAVDIGNTQTALGLFDGEQLVQSWRMPTDHSFTADEIHVRLHGYFHMRGLELDCVDALALAGVVPQLGRAWGGVAERLAPGAAVIVGAETRDAVLIDAPNPAEAGADRVANAVAAAKYYGTPAIVVDFGTATNIDVINAAGAYIGGAIAPGIKISLGALTQRAAKLASIALVAPEHAIGRTTVEAVQSGTVVGAAAMAEGLVARIKAELGAPNAVVIATGGLSTVVAGSTDVFDVVDKQLTLKGICEIYHRVTERRANAAGA